MGNIFVGTQKQGVSRYDNETGEMVSVSYSGYDGQLSVYCMAIVDGQLWVGTDGQGVKIYNPLKDQLEDYRINSASVDFRKGRCIPSWKTGMAICGLACFRKVLFWFQSKKIHSSIMVASLFIIILSDKDV